MFTEGGDLKREVDDTTADLVDLFGQRLDALGVKLSVTHSEDQALELIASIAGEESWVAWRDPLLDRLDLSGPDTEPEAADLSILRADVAIAETGTIGFAHGEGRPRAAALLPEAQIAVVAAVDLVANVEDALLGFFSPDQPAVGPVKNQPDGVPANVIFVTGPSRTADIELRPIIGVHSPKRLDVILVFPGDG